VVVEEATTGGINCFHHICVKNNNMYSQNYVTDCARFLRTRRELNVNINQLTKKQSGSETKINSLNFLNLSLL
jgi:hypothetical protein